MRSKSWEHDADCKWHWQFINVKCIHELYTTPNQSPLVINSYLPRQVCVLHFELEYNNSLSLSSEALSMVIASVITQLRLLFTNCCDDILIMNERNVNRREPRCIWTQLCWINQRRLVLLENRPVWKQHSNSDETISVNGLNEACCPVFHTLRSCMLDWVISLSMQLSILHTDRLPKRFFLNCDFRSLLLTN